jgi:signal transduction histidine kinase
MRSGAMWRTSFAVLEAMIDPVVVLRPLFVGEEVVDFVFVAANDAADRRLTTELDATVIGCLLTDVMPAVIGLGLLASAADVIATGEPRRLEVDLSAGGDDLQRQWEYTGVPYGAFLLVTARDVTERRERDRAQAEVETIKRITVDRERVARDLHDNVIQQVIGASMVLARVASWAEEPISGELEHVISIHDDIVRELRSILFGLQRPVRDLKVEIASIVDRSAGALGFAPRLHVGDLRAASTNQLEAAHMLLTLREALSNAARHASARSVAIHIDALDDRLTMVVDDDGRGMSDQTSRGRGLDNLEARAEMLGGGCEVGPNANGGTCVLWWVPISPAPRERDAASSDAPASHAQDSSASASV